MLGTRCSRACRPAKERSFPKSWRRRRSKRSKISMNICAWDSPVIALVGYRSDPSPSLPSVVNRIRIGSSLLQKKLKSAQPPEYPALARQARVEGEVKLNAVVGKDGSVQNLSVVSGHPLLIPAAIEAVKHWTYEPTAINGSPTDVESEVDVNFAYPPP